MTERQLMEACLKGERSAQYELVRRYAPRLLSVARRYLPPRLDPQDALQDALIRIFGQLHTYSEERGLLWPWMKTIAIRETLKKHRLRKTWHLEAEPPDTELADAPSADWLGHMEVDALLEEISRLPDGYREVFNLVAIEGYSHEECADWLGIAPGTSRSALSRARRLLRQTLMPQHHG